MSESRTRAANGRSSIYQGADGTWHAYVVVGTKPDGTLDRRHRRGKTRTEVSAKAAELEGHRQGGTVTKAGRPQIVADYLHKWLDSKRLTVKPKTIVGYNVDIRRHIVPVIGSVRLTAVRPEDVEQIYTAMTVRGSSASTVAHVKRTLSSAFNQAVKRGLMPRNPVPLASAPRVVEKEVEPLTRDEARRVLEVAAEARNGGAWIIALSLGLRRGEVLGLRWQDVDLDAETLAVRRSAQRLSWQHGCPDAERCGFKPARCPQRHGGGIVFDTPKSTAGGRVVPLPVPLVNALRQHRRRQHEERLRAGSRWQDRGLVFAQLDGKPLDPDRHSQAWRKLLAEAGVRPARLHDARHTAATLLLVQGVDSRVVMALMGWSHQSMTRRYQHVVPELARDAADRMSAALWDATATTTATTGPGRL
jgi:integrase